jgi:hypothetical protein
VIVHADLRRVLVAAVCLAVAALVVPTAWLSFVLLAPLAFFLTGYAILAAAFVDGPQRWPRAFWFSLALSLAVLALVPLPLTFLGGITPATCAVALVLVVLISCAIASSRRPARWEEADGLPAPRLPKPSPLAWALGLGALLLVAGAIVLAHVPLSNSRALGFTELSLRPIANGTRVRIGVGNEEQHFTSFRVRATFGSGPGARVVHRVLSLYPGSSTTFDLTVVPKPEPDHPVFATVFLYRPGETGLPYRRVYGWIPAGPEE